MKIPQIQALRALAAGLVLLFHARIVGGGFIGVDIFYVISGFLITGLILKEIEKTGKFSQKEFYVRRAKRLLPTSFSILAITAIASWIIMPITMRQTLGKDIIAASLYVSNYLFALWGNDYQNLNATPSPVIHYWSLAVEEQFYIFWPIIIYTLYKIGKRRAVFVGVLATTFASLLFSIYLTNASPVWAFYSLPTRAWELGIGALLLFIPHRIFERVWVVYVAFFALVATNFIFVENTPFPGYRALLPVVATALAIASIKAWPPIFNVLGNNKFSQWIGEISYPLYLWHWPLLVLPSTYLGRPLHLFERALAVLATIIAAHLTHVLIEEPLRHKHFESAIVIKTALVGTASSAMVGALIFFTYSNHISIPKSSITFVMEEVMAKPAVYGDGCHSNYKKNYSDACEYGDLNSNKKVVLYGDSHAAQWFPALEEIARKNHFTLISLTKSACPSAEVLRGDQGGFKFENCKNWRIKSIERINQMKPDAVILSGFQHYGLPSGVSDRKQWWLEGERKLLEKIAPSQSKIIYISDTPLPDRDIPSCLASHPVEKCSATRSSVQVIPQFKAINPTPWLCSTTCPSVVDNIIAYRDDSHISVAMAKALVSPLESKLRALGLI